MIAGIIIVVILLLGIICTVIGFDDDNGVFTLLGIILFFIGIFGLFAFLSVNADTIQNWLKI